MKVYRLNTDGTIERMELDNHDSEAEYQSIRDAIGGYIEFVRISPRGTAALIVDEEGLLKGLDLNPVATLLAERPLVGPALLVGIAPGPDGDVCTDTPAPAVKYLEALIEEQEREEADDEPEMD